MTVHRLDRKARQYAGFSTTVSALAVSIRLPTAGSSAHDVEPAGFITRMNTFPLMVLDRYVPPLKKLTDSLL